MSFWRVWLLNIRQRVRCSNCERVVEIKAPGRIAIGTFAMLLAAMAVFITPGGDGFGLGLLLLGLVANFVLTHAFIELEEAPPSDPLD